MTGNRNVLRSCMATPRPLEIAQHEAAHVVVGVALGLRLREAVLRVEALPGGWEGHGYVLFRGVHGGRQREALALMYAAGCAWEEAVGGGLSEGDERLCRGLVTSARGVRVCVRAAGAMLAGLGAAHARVTRALLERDLTARDIATLARGERLRHDDA